MPGDDDERLILVSFTWAGDGPQLRIRPVDGPSRLVPAVGFSINYQVGTPVVHCPGRVPFRSEPVDYIDCFNPPQPGGRTCVECAVAEATLAGSLHHAHLRDPDELDPAVASHLGQPNGLYLAAFRDGSLKVGTSTTVRQENRLLEQGAWLATVIGRTTNGFVVRRLEDMITERLGIPQSVAVGRKLKGLLSPIDDARLKRRLDETTLDVQRLLSEFTGTGSASDREVEPADEPWSNPLADSPLVDGLLGYGADLGRNSHDLTIVAMIGRLALIERGTPAADSAPIDRVRDRFAVDVGQLFGLELHLGQFTPVEVAVQDRLF